MSPSFTGWKKIAIFQAAALVLILLAPGGCDTRRNIFTIGIVAWDTPAADRQLSGFRDAMAKLGYVGGQTVEYIYETIPGDKLYDIRFIDSQLKKIFVRDLDLLLVVGQEVTTQAKFLVGGTELPVLFSGTAWPVESGFVESISHPGGNMTGVRFADCVPKALELLGAIGGIKKAYLPYNPNDVVSIMAMKGLDETAGRFGIELVTVEIFSVEEAAKAIENLPEDIDAVFRIPSPTLDHFNDKLSSAAIKRGLPLVAPILLDDAVLVTIGNDEYNIGAKLARQAQQIEHGVKPRELPVETAEIFLTVNLDTAEKIGRRLPDEILAQAKKIIR